MAAAAAALAAALVVMVMAMVVVMMVVVVVVMVVMMVMIVMVVEMMLVHGSTSLGIFLYYTDSSRLCQTILFPGNIPREGLRKQGKAGIIKAPRKEAGILSDLHQQPHSHIYLHAHGMSHSHGHVHENQKAVVNRLARAIGHLEKVKRMVEEGYDCSEVLVQLAAVRSALDNTGKVILKDHMRHCMVDAVAAGDSDAIDDLCSAIDRFMK